MDAQSIAQHGIKITFRMDSTILYHPVFASFAASFSKSRVKLPKSQILTLLPTVSLRFWASKKKAIYFSQLNRTEKT